MWRDGTGRNAGLAICDLPRHHSGEGSARSTLAAASFAEPLMLLYVAPARQTPTERLKIRRCSDAPSAPPCKSQVERR